MEPIMKGSYVAKHYSHMFVVGTVQLIVKLKFSFSVLECSLIKPTIRDMNKNFYLTLNQI